MNLIRTNQLLLPVICLICLAGWLSLVAYHVHSGSKSFSGLISQQNKNVKKLEASDKSFGQFNSEDQLTNVESEWAFSNRGDYSFGIATIEKKVDVLKV